MAIDIAELIGQVSQQRRTPGEFMQRIAIVDPTEHSRESLRALLLGVDFVWLEAECARYEYFFDVIQGSMPDLAIVALDADKGKALQMIGQLSVEHPKLPILTISNDHQALLQSLQRGARYFLMNPIGLEDLLNALRRALGDNPTAEMQQEGGSGAAVLNQVRNSGTSQIISFIGSRGGVGTTTLAVNLAATLASDPANTVALIDLDLALGDADIALEVSGMDNISIADVARNIERLDMGFLRRALVKHEGTNLSILRHPIEIADVSLIHEAHVERILNLLKISYSHLVLDLTKGLTAVDLMALRMSDMVLMTAQLELSSLRNVVRLNHAFGGPDGFSERVRVVLNRVGADSIEEGISLKKAEEVISKPILWQVPFDPKPIIAARVAGEPLVKHAPKSRAQQAIVGLANLLTGKSTVTSAEPARKSMLGGLFGKR
jgi:pilus assembly protein CpaE